MYSIQYAIKLLTNHGTRGEMPDAGKLRIDVILSEINEICTPNTLKIHEIL
jgi:hypothetical protein